MNPKEERTWSTFIHLGGLIGMWIIPTVGNIIGALVLWLIKRNDSHVVDDQGKEAVNFQITYSLAVIAAKIVENILYGIWSVATFWSRPWWNFSFTWGWGSLVQILWVLNVIFSIVAAVRANEGKVYRYPLSLRLVK